MRGRTPERVGRSCRKWWSEGDVRVGPPSGWLNGGRAARIERLGPVWPTTTRPTAGPTAAADPAESSLWWPTPSVKSSFPQDFS